MKTNLKRYIALFLAALMVLALFAGCDKNKDEDEDDSSKVSSEFEGKLLEPYIEIISTNSYTYEATQSGGKPVTYAKDGDDKILITTTSTVEDSDYTLTIMKLSDKIYIVVPAEKAYTEASEAEIEKYNLENLFSSLTLDNFANSSFVGDGTTTYKDVEYKYEDYYNALSQITNRFFFDDDDNLVMVANVKSNGKIKSPNSIKIYATNSNTFDILKDYSLVSQDSTATTKASDSNQTTTASTTSLIG